jgi:hypothetical protein
MRPKFPDKEKRKILVRLLLAKEDKIQRLSTFTIQRRFPFMSDYLVTKYLISPGEKF